MNSDSLFNLANASDNHSLLIDSLEGQVNELLVNWFTQEDFLIQAAIPFSATSGSSEWNDNALALKESILNNNYSIRLEVRTASEMKGALGAYSSSGTSDKATIYLNRDWLATASHQNIINVLLEEIGHDFDHLINDGADSPGDEGAIFANLVSGRNLSAAEQAAILKENDSGTLNLDGQDVAVEFAALDVINNNNATVLRDVLLGSDPSRYAGMNDIVVTAPGDSRAYGTFTQDPFGLNGGVVISTGLATNVNGPNNDQGAVLDTDLGASGTSGDAITLTITFDLDTSAQGVFFTYVFGSEEFPEFAQAGFNDDFIISVNGTNLAKLNDGRTVSIDNLVAVQNDPSSGSPDYVDNNTTNPSNNTLGGNGTLNDETQLDGYTKPLYLVVLPGDGVLNFGGSNTITITIRDIGDAAYDSAAFFQAGSLGTTPPITTTVAVDSLTTNNGSPEITGTVDNPFATVEVTINGTTYNATNNGDGTWTLPADTISPNLTDATYDVSVEATDAFGLTYTDNTTNELTVDTTIATPTVVSQITNDTTPVLTGTAEAGSTVTVVVGGATYTTTADGTGNWTIDTETDTPTSDTFTPDVNGVNEVVVTSTDAAGNSATDTTTGELTIDTTPPTITINPIATDDIINATEAGSPVTISGTTIGVEDGQTVTVNLNGTDYTATVTSNAWTLNVPVADVANLDPSETVTADVSDAAGNPATQATKNITVDTVAPSITINLDANITADDIINAAEAGQNIPITGTVGGDVVDGDTVTLTVNGNTYTGTVTGGAFSIDVAGSDLAADPDTTIEASVTTTDTAGNSTTATDTESYSVDTIAPDAPTVTITEDTNNDGLINSQELDGDINVSVELPTNAVAGDTLTVTNGTTPQTITLTQAQINNGVVTTTFPSPGEGNTLEVSAFVTDAAGNQGNTGTDSAVIDTIAPDAPTVTITEDTNNDGVINSQELDGDINVSVELPTNAVAGDTLTVTDGTTPQTIALTQAQINNGVVTTTFSAPANGSTFNVEAYVTDSSGNQGENATDSAVMALALPNRPIVVITEDTNNDGLINSQELDGDINVSVELPTNAVVGDTLTVTDGTTPQTITLTQAQINNGVVTTTFPSPGEGNTLEVSAFVTDAAGNQGNTGTDSALIDTIAPDAPTVTITEDTNNDGVINSQELDGDINVSVNLPEDAVVGDELTITDGITPQTVTLTQKDIDNGVITTRFSAPLEDDTITVSAYVTDEAGNQGETATDSALIDTTAPVVSINPLTTNDTTPILSGTVDDPNATVTVTVNDNDYEAINNGDGTWSLDIPDVFPDGIYDVIATATDEAGNEGLDDSADELTIDTTGVNVTIHPLLVRGEIGTYTRTSDKTPTISGEIDDLTAIITVTIDGETYTNSDQGDNPNTVEIIENPFEATSEYTPTHPYLWRVTLPEEDKLATDGDGTDNNQRTYEVSVKAEDTAGNADDTKSSIIVFEIDATLPVVEITGPEGFITDTTPEITGTVNKPSAQVQVTVNDQTFTATVNPDGTWSVLIPEELADGNYPISVVATDSFGNKGYDDGGFKLDTVAPGVTVTPQITSDTTPIITGTVSVPEATVKVTVNGTEYEATNNQDGTWTLEIPDELSDGTYDVTATATDLAGNVGTEDTTGELVINQDAPKVSVNPIESREPQSILTGLVDDPDATVIVTIDGVEYTAVVDKDNPTPDGEYPWTLELDEPLTDGITDVQVRATDLDGNVGTDNSTNEIKVNSNDAPIFDIDEDQTIDGQPIDIEIRDINGEEVIYVTVPENTTEITTLGVLQVGAVDSNGDLINYSIIDGADANLFNIDPTGLLFFRQLRDYDLPRDQDKNNIYELVVAIDDNRLDGQTTKRIIVEVTDIDEPPFSLSDLILNVTDDTGKAQLDLSDIIVDPEGNQLEFFIDPISLANLPEGFLVELDENEPGRFGVKVPFGYTGEVNINIGVIDGDNTYLFPLTVRRFIADQDGISDKVEKRYQGSTIDNYFEDVEQDVAPQRDNTQTRPTTILQGEIGSDNPDAEIIVTFNGQEYTAQNNGDGTWTLEVPSTDIPADVNPDDVEVTSFEPEETTAAQSLNITNTDGNSVLTGTVDNFAPDEKVVITIDGEEYEAINNGDGTWTLEVPFEVSPDINPEEVQVTTFNPVATQVDQVTQSEQPLTIFSGTIADPVTNIEIYIELYNQNGDFVEKFLVQVDENGNWSLDIATSYIINNNIDLEDDGIRVTQSTPTSVADRNQDGKPDFDQNYVTTYPLIGFNLDGNNDEDIASYEDTDFATLVAGVPQALQNLTGDTVDQNALFSDIDVRGAIDTNNDGKNDVLDISGTINNDGVTAAPEGIDFPVGLTTFTISNLTDIRPDIEGTQVRVTLILPDGGLNVNTFYKFGPTADNPTDHWYEFLADGDLSTFDPGAELIDIDGDGDIDYIVLNLTDGGLGDSDLTENGVIIDPGTPALDNTAPVVTINPLSTNDSTPTLTGTVDDPEATVIVSVNGIDYTAVNNGDGTWTLEVPDEIPEGIYEVSATAIDTLGNEGVDGSTDELEIDTTAPVVTVNPLETNDSTPILTGTVDDPNAVVTVTVNGEEYEAVNNGDGTWTLEVPDLIPDGVYDVTVTATDPVGNEGVDDSTDELSIDSTAPGAPTVIIDEDEDNNGVINNSELNGDIDVSVDLPADAVAGDTLTVTDGTTPQTFILTQEQINAGVVSTTFSAPDNGSTFNVEAFVTDQNNNQGQSDTDTAVLALALPDVPIVIITEDTNNNGVINSEELEGDIGVNVTLPTNAVAGDTLTVTDGTTPQTFILTQEQIDAGVVNTTFTSPGEGNTLEVSAFVTDTNGNQGESATDSALLDTTAPSAPTVSIDEDANNDGVINSSELDGDIDVSVELPADAVTGDTLTVTDGTTPQTFILTQEQIDAGVVNTTFTSPGEGNTLKVEAFVTDANGNQGESATDSAVIDTTAPVVTVNPLETNDGTPVLTGTIDDPEAEITVTVNGNDYTAVNNGDGTWTLEVPDLIPDGIYDVTVTATDTLGNEGVDDTTDELTIDTIAPVVTVNPLKTNDNTPVLTGTIDDPEAIISVTVNGIDYTAVNNGDGTWTLQITDVIPEGIYNVTATATDALGNENVDDTANELELDNVVPVVTVNPLETNDGTPVLTGTIDDPQAVISVTINGIDYTAVNNGDGTWSLEIPDVIPDGIYDISVTAIDELGNEGTDETTDELEIDTTAPVVTINELITYDQTPTLTGTIDDPTLPVLINVNGKDYTAVNNEDGTWSLEIPDLTPQNTYDVTATATDAVGNQGTDTTTNELTILDICEDIHLVRNDEGQFQIVSEAGINGENVNLRFELTGVDAEFVNEVGIVKVDENNQITDINNNLIGIDNDQYKEEALRQGLTIFSALSDDTLTGDNPLRHLSNYATGDRFLLYLIANNSADQVLANDEVTNPIFFSLDTANSNNQSYLDVIKETQRYQLVTWEDSTDNDLNDLEMSVEVITSDLTTSAQIANLQSQQQSEVIDLREVAGETVQMLFTLNSNADEDNIVGFYRIDDPSGGILDGNGQLVRPTENNRSRYLELAQNNLVGTNLIDEYANREPLHPELEHFKLPGIREPLAVSKYVVELETGSLYAPLIAKGNSINGSEPMFFSFMELNNDGQDHIRSLGENIWGFEDSVDIDSDFNDLVIRGEIISDVLDLTEITDTVAEVTFTVNRYALNNNIVSFYQVDDYAGGIIDSETGTKVTATETNRELYLELVKENLVSNLNLTSPNNDEYVQVSVEMEAGKLYAPILASGSDLSAALDSGDVFFAFEGVNSDGTDHVDYLGENAWGFEDIVQGGDRDFNDLIVKAEITYECCDCDLLYQTQILDLTSVDEEVAQLYFNVTRQAAYNNVIGFYKVNDYDGGIVDSLTGEVVEATSANKERYLQLVQDNLVTNVSLKAENGEVADFTVEMEAGELYAPILVRGNDLNVSLASETVYFAFEELNSDGINHIQRAGKNAWGFEDLNGGGDSDFNDLIIEVELGGHNANFII